MNVYGEEWGEQPYRAPPGWEQKVARLLPPGRRLGVTLYELLPGQTQVPYHFPHGNDEALVVLRGRPTVRTPEGERELEPGEVVFFPHGREGAHQVVNRSDEPARYLIAASHVSPGVVEHLDSGKVLAMSQEGLWTVHRLADGVDYFEGEEPRA